MLLVLLVLFLVFSVLVLDVVAHCWGLNFGAAAGFGVVFFFTNQNQLNRSRRGRLHTHAYLTTPLEPQSRFGDKPL